MRHLKNGFVIFLLLVLSPSLRAQDEDRMDLRNVLRQLEVRFNVSFTYADENIRGRTVSGVDYNSPLADILRKLQDQTGLVFRRLNERFIAIVLPDSEIRSVCGIVLDGQTGRPLAGVTVTSPHSFSITDSLGFFRLPAAEGDSLELRSLGYLTLKILARQDDCPQVKLTPEVLTLREVIIRDVITVGIDQTAKGSVVVDTKRLGILPGLIEPDVLQTVQALPGIQSISEKISDINIRGGTNDQNYVSWNGIKMYQTGHFFGLISAFNPYLTDQVTFVRNGTPARLGDGVSGSLLMETDERVSRAWGGSAGVNMIYADAWTKIPVTDQLSVQLSGRRSVTDLVTTPTYEKYYDRIFTNTEVEEASRAGTDATDREEDFYFYDVSAIVLYEPGDRDKLRLSLLQVYNDISYDESGQRNGITEEKTSTLSQQTSGGGLQWKRAWSGRLSSEMEATWSSYKLEAVNQDIVNEQRLLQENSVLEYFVHTGLGYRLLPRTLVSAGYQLRETGITNFDELNNPLFVRRIKEVVRTHAGYASFSWQSQDNTLRAEGGVRTNYYEKLKELTFEPRLSLYKSLPLNFAVQVQGEMKSQVTTQVIDFQRDFLGVEKRRWLLANGADVPVIKSRQVSAGIMYQPEGLLVSADIYLKQVDGITTSSQGFVNQFARIRTAGNYRSRGVDVLIRRKFLYRMNTWLSYSYMENDYEFESLIPSEFPSNLDIRHSLSFGMTYQGRKLEVSTGINWHSGMPFTLAEGVDNAGISIVYGPPNQERLKDYYRLDVSARYNFRLSETVKVQVGAAVWNLTNTSNQLAAFYRIGPDGQPARFNEYALGLTPNLLLRISF